MIPVSQRGTPVVARKPLLCKGFSVERVTGIEPAWPAWKASGTRSRLSVKIVLYLRISVHDLDRCSPYCAPFYRPYGPATAPLDTFGSTSFEKGVCGYTLDGMGAQKLRCTAATDGSGGIGRAVHVPDPLVGTRSSTAAFDGVFAAIGAG